LAGKPDEKKLLGRPRRRWEDNIKMNLQKLGWEYGLECYGLGWEQVAYCCECGNEPLVYIKCGEFLD
jgi:hypothetical protein